MLFTGLVEEIGRVAAIKRQGEEVMLAITAGLVTQELAKGDSVCVNGACLTVTELAAARFVALAMLETVQRTTLSRLAAGDRVNLERALRLGDRLGGHLVQGHVDGVGQVIDIRPEGAARRLEIGADTGIMQFIVEKGSIAVDGVSLTVAGSSSGSFSVALIPHTQGVTTLQYLRAGDEVNLETDIVGKYVARLLQPAPAGGLSLDTLRNCGFA